VKATSFALKNGESFAVRQMTRKDLLDWVRLFNASGDREVSHFTLRGARVYFADRFDRNSVDLVAERGNRVIGYKGLHIFKTRELRDVAVLDGTYVLPSYRRLGVATKLWDSIIRVAQDRKINSMIGYGPLPSNREMLSFFRRRGETFCGSLRMYLSTKDGLVDLPIVVLRP
jgi:GNAT superfamily N-acetyltransferase